MSSLGIKLALSLFVGAVIALIILSQRDVAEPSQAAAKESPRAGRAFNVGQKLAPPTTTATAPKQPEGSPVGSDASDDVLTNSDPLSQDYDPVIVNRLRHIEPADLYAQEPRVAAFADARELALRNRIGERLRARGGFTGKLDVSCHTSSCEITLQRINAEDDLGKALQAIEINGLTESGSVGPLADRGNSKQPGLSIVMLFSKEDRDSYNYDILLKKHAQHDQSSQPPP